MNRAASLVLCALLTGCDARPIELSVDLRTDLVAGTDFEAVRVELMPGQGAFFDPVTHAASSSEPWASGVRVAEFVSVPAGASRVRAALLDAAGGEIAGRAVDVTLTGDYALTIVITADCVGRTCPGATEPGSHTQCLHGQCIDPRCGGSSPEGCGTLACESATDCVGRLSCVASCIGGACACTAPEIDAGPTMIDAGPVDAGPFDAGPFDAGPCMGECTPGQMDEESRACGACGEGTERRTRTCGADCMWGAFGAFGACQTSATCTPGATDRDTRACGNCGQGSQSRSRSCNATTCTWNAFGNWSTCSGGGTCAPGDTRAGGCDPCAHQVCNSSCNWGGCTLRGSSQCMYEGGTNWRCCGGSRWQFCLSSCQWSSDCAACSGCGC